jgi:hypothetical protein
MEHIITACPILAKELYIKRHDIVCSTALYHMQGKWGEIRQQTRHKHVPKLQETTHEGTVTTLWNE